MNAAESSSSDDRRARTSQRRITNGLTRLAVATIAVLAFTACGGSGSSSPEEDVKQVAGDFLEAVIDGRNGEACALTTDAGECISALVVAGGLVGEGGFEALLGDEWRGRLEAGGLDLTAAWSRWRPAGVVPKLVAEGD